METLLLKFVWNCREVSYGIARIPNNPKVKTNKQTNKKPNKKSEKWKIKLDDSYFQSQNLVQRYSSYENYKDL